MTPHWIQKTNFDIKRLKKALIMAQDFHAHQKRKDGQPYIVHPIAVAKIIYQAGGDEDMICSAFLHDAIEDYTDPQMAAEQIQKFMGTHVYFTVDALSKDARICSSTQQQDLFFEQFKNAISQDISVFFIKLADLIHNLETICSLQPHKKEKWIRELKRGYIPILSDFYGQIPLPYRSMYHYLIDRLLNTFAHTD